MKRCLEDGARCIVLIALVVNLHLLPGLRPAQADDPAPAEPWCFPMSPSPEQQRLIDTQYAVYDDLFISTFDPCDDPGLLLDDPLDGSVLPAFATGRNSADEAFTVEVLAWFPLDPDDLSAEDQALIDEWQVVAGLAVAEVATQLGAIRVAAYAVSAEPLDGSAPRTNVLVPVMVFPDDAWDALWEYTYGEWRAYWNPCDRPLDEQAQICLGICRDKFVDTLNNCKDTTNGCLGRCGWLGTLAVLTCIIGAVTGGSTFWPCVGLSVAASGCVVGCLNTFAGCVAGAKATYDNCVAGCCSLLELRTEQTRQP